MVTGKTHTLKLDDDDDDDWLEDEWEEEPPKKRTNKFKRKSKERPYPRFNWSGLDRATSGLKTLIRAAEKKLVPDDGLEFSYASVDLVAMEELEDNYLCDLSNDAESSGYDDDVGLNNTLYHDYLTEIITWHLKQ